MTDIDQAGWHPRIRSLHDYWQAIRPASGLPGRQHLDPCDIPALLRNICLIDVGRDPLSLRYRLMGTEICRRLGHDFTGSAVEAAHGAFGPGEAQPEAYGPVIAGGALQWRRWRPEVLTESCWPEVETIMLPLARDGRSVDMLLCATVFYPRGNQPRPRMLPPGRNDGMSGLLRDGANGG